MDNSINYEIKKNYYIENNKIYMINFDIIPEMIRIAYLDLDNSGLYDTDHKYILVFIKKYWFLLDNQNAIEKLGHICNKTIYEMFVKYQFKARENNKDYKISKNRAYALLKDCSDFEEGDIEELNDHDSFIILVNCKEIF